MKTSDNHIDQTGKSPKKKARRISPKKSEITTDNQTPSQKETTTNDTDKCSDALLYYKIVMTQRAKGSRKIKPRDFITEEPEVSESDSEYLYHSSDEEFCNQDSQ